MSARRLADPSLQDELLDVLILSRFASRFAIREATLVVGILQMLPAIVGNQAKFIDITMELDILLNALVQELEDVIEAVPLREAVYD